MRFEKYLLSEGKAKVTPHLKSMFKKIDTIDKATAEKIASDLDGVGFDKSTKVSVGVGENDQPYVGIMTQDRKYDDKDELLSKVKQSLKSSGKKVSNTKITSQQLFVYFK